MKRFLAKLLVFVTILSCIQIPYVFDTMNLVNVLAASPNTESAHGSQSAVIAASNGDSHPDPKWEGVFVLGYEIVDKGTVFEYQGAQMSVFNAYDAYQYVLNKIPDWKASTITNEYSGNFANTLNEDSKTMIIQFNKYAGSVSAYKYPDNGAVQYHSLCGHQRDRSSTDRSLWVAGRRF